MSGILQHGTQREKRACPDGHAKATFDAKGRFGATRRFIRLVPSRLGSVWLLRSVALETVNRYTFIYETITSGEHLRICNGLTWAFGYPARQTKGWRISMTVRSVRF